MKVDNEIFISFLRYLYNRDGDKFLMSLKTDIEKKFITEVIIKELNYQKTGFKKYIESDKFYLLKLFISIGIFCNSKHNSIIYKKYKFCFNKNINNKNIYIIKILGPEKSCYQGMYFYLDIINEFFVSSIYHCNINSNSICYGNFKNHKDDIGEFIIMIKNILYNPNYSSPLSTSVSKKIKVVRDKNIDFQNKRSILEKKIDTLKLYDI